MSALSFARSRVAEAARYVRADARAFALAVAVTALPQILADALLTDRSALFVAGMLGLLQVYVDLLITYRALHRAGAAPPGYALADLTEGRFGSAFAMSLLSTVAIGVGLLLLVVPGVLLFLLWSLALPILAAERADAIDALRRSWRLARPSLAPLGAVLTVWVVAFAALLGVSMLLDLTAPPLPANVVLNIAFAALLPFTAALWAFAYAALRPLSDSRSATA